MAPQTTRIRSRVSPTPSPLPPGFSSIPGGKFQDVVIKPFGFKQKLVTNAEWKQSLDSQDRFVLLHYNWETGEAEIERKGSSIKEVLGSHISPAIANDIDKTNFSQCDVLIFGSQILLEMAPDPAAKYDERGEQSRIFSGEDQPVVGITFFHAQTWCLLKTLKDSKFKYSLPTDKQFGYVAGHGGRKYGTGPGGLFDSEGRKLAHIDENKNGKGTTVSVNDKRYALQKFPFDVDLAGNAWRLIAYNPERQPDKDSLWIRYGLRGGAWNSLPEQSLVSSRAYLPPDTYKNTVGFSPVVVPKNSK